MSAILKTIPPDLTVASGSRIPAGLERIVRHCLEKDPAQRFQSARDVAFALGELASMIGSSPAIQDSDQRERDGLSSGS